MSDNERIDQLVSSILAAVNESQLPLGVKALALENILFRVKDAIRQQKSDQKEALDKEEAGQ